MHHLTFFFFAVKNTMQINFKHHLGLMALYMCQAFVIASASAADKHKKMSLHYYEWIHRHFCIFHDESQITSSALSLYRSDEL